MYLKKVKNKLRIKAHIYSFSNRHRIMRKLYDAVERAINTKRTYKGQIRDGWSFIIVSGGNDLITLGKSVDKIITEFKGEDNFEVIIVGPNKCKKIKNKNVRYITFREIGILPGWITIKKNLGVKNSKYDKVVVSHDYIGVEPGWLDGFKKFGSDFDVCVTQVLLDNGKRTRDWMTWDYPDIGPGLLPYSVECTKYQYINGAYFICKRDFYIDNPLDESRRWGEEEDIEWSKRIREKTIFRINTNSKVRYLKSKPVDAAPYCDSWMKNTEKINQIFTK